MKKRIKITESQFNRLMENVTSNDNEVNIAKALASIDCSGEDLKDLVHTKLNDLGFEDVRIKFLGFDGEDKHLMYIVYTEGPVFIFRTESSRDDEDTPCQNVFWVQAYNKSFEEDKHQEDNVEES